MTGHLEISFDTWSYTNRNLSRLDAIFIALSSHKGLANLNQLSSKTKGSVKKIKLAITNLSKAVLGVGIVFLVLSPGVPIEHSLSMIGLGGLGLNALSALNTPPFWVRKKLIRLMKREYVEANKQVVGNLDFLKVVTKEDHDRAYKFLKWKHEVNKRKKIYFRDLIVASEIDGYVRKINGY